MDETCRPITENTQGHIHTSYNNVLKLPPGVEFSKTRYSSPLPLLILPQGHIHSPTTHTNGSPYCLSRTRNGEQNITTLLLHNGAATGQKWAFAPCTGWATAGPWKVNICCGTCIVCQATSDSGRTYFLLNHATLALEP